MADLNSFSGRQTRRGFLGTILAGSAIGALGACTVTKSGSVTTVTLNVAKVKAYGTAGLNAVSLILSVAAISTAIGAPGVAIITAADTALSAALATFASAAGNSVTLTYDSASPNAAVTSLLDDLQTVVADLDSALTGAESKVTSSDLSTATMALDALKTIVSVFEALTGLTSIARSAALRPVGTRLTETQALSILRVSVVQNEHAMP